MSENAPPQIWTAFKLISDPQLGAGPSRIFRYDGKGKKYSFFKDVWISDFSAVSYKKIFRVRGLS